MKTSWGVYFLRIRAKKIYVKPVLVLVLDVFISQRLDWSPSLSDEYLEYSCLFHMGFSSINVVVSFRVPSKKG